MRHWPKARIGYKPLSACIKRKIHGLFRARVETHPAPLARDGIHHEILADRLPTAQLAAQPALGTLVRIDDCRITGCKIVPFSDFRGHDQMQIRCVHVRIAQHLAFPQCGKRRHQAGFACSAFSADDHQFLHIISRNCFTSRLTSEALIKRICPPRQLHQSECTIAGSVLSTAERRLRASGRANTPARFAGQKEFPSGSATFPSRHRF